MVESTPSDIIAQGLIARWWRARRSGEPFDVFAREVVYGLVVNR